LGEKITNQWRSKEGVHPKRRPWRRTIKILTVARSRTISCSSYLLLKVAFKQ